MLWTSIGWLLALLKGKSAREDLINMELVRFLAVSLQSLNDYWNLSSLQKKKDLVKWI